MLPPAEVSAMLSVIESWRSAAGQVGQAGQVAEKSGLEASETRTAPTESQLTKRAHEPTDRSACSGARLIISLTARSSTFMIPLKAMRARESEVVRSWT